MCALNIPVSFYQKNVLQRAERQHNPVLRASLPCAERGRASVSSWSLESLPEPGNSGLHQHKQGDHLPLDLCMKNLNGIAERERERIWQSRQKATGITLPLN